MSGARARVVVLALCGLLLATVLVVLADREADRRPLEATTSAGSCTDALLVLVPGNGEGITNSKVAGGKTLHRFRDRYLAAAEAGGRSVDVRVVQFRSQPLARLNVPGKAGRPANRAVTEWRVSTWDKGVPAAVDATFKLLFDRQAACPDQSIVLAGYAQGAGVVHRTLTKFSPTAKVIKRVVGAALISDPGRRSGTAANLMGNPAAARNAVGIMRARRGASWADVPLRSTYMRINSICRRGDMVCDFRGQTVGNGVAMAGSYLRYNPGQIDSAAADLFRRTRAVALPTPATVTMSGQLGVPVSRQLAADTRSDFRSHLRWSPVSGLPPGLTLSSKGLLSGRPTSTGSFTIRYTVRNSVHPQHARPVPGVVRLTVSGGGISTNTAGGDSSCTVKADATMWCWGDNYEGQLGQGNRTNQTKPVRMGSGAYWVAVDTGGTHTCGIRKAGSLWCFGRNDFGQIGDGTRTRRLRPVQIGSGQSWASVSTNNFHTCAITRAGALYCWGKNDEGQLADGTRTTRARPVRVGTASNWSTVSAGGWHTCATRKDGSAWCWGANEVGQLGNARDMTGRTGPVRVAGDAQWQEVSAGEMHSCGVLVGGGARCWGANTAGQLGDGSTRTTNAPAAVGGSTKWVDIDAGLLASCGVASTGVVHCWGSGHTGALGNDSVRWTATQPRAVSGSARYVAVHLGWGHTCATETTGHTSCWGVSTAGQVGDGTHTTRRTPKRVLPG